MSGQPSNKHYLQSKMKSSGLAFLFWFLAGFHFAYLGKWGLQILFLLTLGGLGIWWFIELFVLSGRVNAYNASISQRIQEIEDKEKATEHARNMAMIAAATGRKGTADGDKNKGEADAEGE